MFCPKCAAENADTAQFCRGCGANISLVPQAVTGQLAARLEKADEGSRFDHRVRHRRGEPVTIERAVRSLFMGIAFVFVAFAARAWAPAGNIWWFWLFIPAAGMLADGVSTYIRLRAGGEGERHAAFAPPTQRLGGAARAGALPPRDTGEIVQPPSVTEATTRHLAVSRERKSGDV